MTTPGTKSRSVLPRTVIVAGVVALASAAAFYALQPTPPQPLAAVPVAAPTVVAAAQPTPVKPPPVALAPVVPVPAPPPPPPPAPVAAVPPSAPAPVAPTFDVVRVSPQGSAIIAGRAEPGAEVILRDGDKELARTRADRRGEFVALPAAPLPAGGRELTLASRDGTAPEVKGDASVVLVVPPAPTPPAAAAPTVPLPQPPVVAMLVPRAAPPRLLQEGPRPSAPVSLDIVDYDDHGAIRFTGAAAPGAALRVYVDNAAAGDARSDAAGRWSLTPAAPVAPGVHTLRVDSIDPAGKVLARVELPFQRAAPAAAEPASGRLVVQPGHNLWRLARAAYGRGVQYTVIYAANRDQLRDPHHIYPGQALSVPAAP